MKTHHLVLACVAALVASAAHAVEVGQCGRANPILRTLAEQGQRVLVDAQQPGARASSRLRITSNAEGSLGYVLSGDAKVCIQARVSDIRSAPAAVAVAVADPLFVTEVRPQCDKPRADKAWCGSLEKVARKAQALDVARVIKVGPSQSLAPIDKRAAPGTRTTEHWSSAEYGFCHNKGTRLVLCIATHTLASSQ